MSAIGGQLLYSNGFSTLIQSVLLFLLGFFTAGFLALLAAPILWRRAVYLTKRRIEASMPLSVNELEAEKDRLRAEHAMSARRLEMNVEALNRKTAQQMAELARLEEQALGLADMRGKQDVALERLREETAGQKANLEESAKAIAGLTERLEGAEEELQVRAGAIDKLEEIYEEERVSASTRQIELANRDSELRRMEAELSAERKRRREAVNGLREATGARHEAEEAFKAEQKRAAELQRKLEARITVLSDREELLERRESEIARLRKDLKAAGGVASSDEADAKPVARKGAVAVAAADDEGFSVEREKLQTRLSKLLKENKKLRAELKAAATAAPASDVVQKDAGQPVSDSRLRDQISTLAAEVVSLAAALEGPGAVIDKALSADTDAEDESRPISLADRVRALRAAAKS